MKRMNHQERTVILEAYQKGLSSYEIKELLKLPISIRQIQRIVKAAGIIRTAKQAFNLAISKGRVHFKKHPDPNRVKRLAISNKLRYQTLERDNFKCVFCGQTARQSLLEVDHKDENRRNSDPENLQTVCEECNKGKAYNKNPYFKNNPTK